LAWAHLQADARREARPDSAACLEQRDPRPPRAADGGRGECGEGRSVKSGLTIELQRQVRAAEALTAARLTLG
jgi:hypothetical protein